jgi:GTP-binding protein YchF
LFIGIIGLPMVGKTTLFNLMTNARAGTSNFFSGKTEANVGTAVVPDARIDFLSALYKPRKTIYAQIELTDVAGLVRGAGQGQGVGNQFMAAIRNADALVHVIRAFADKEVPHVDGSVDPLRDWETIDMELLVADLEIVERNIERLSGTKKIKPEQAATLSGLRKCRDALEEEKAIHSVAFSAEEEEALRSYSFFTEKPYVLVVNLDEAQLKAGDYPGKAALTAKAAERGVPVVELGAKIEVELSELDAADREMFMEDLGIAEPGINRLVRATYHRLGLISFFTVGEDEVRAWTVAQGTDAKKAAGRIHSDIEKGFIRAEVFHYNDIAAHGTAAKVKEKGLFRLEGKEYTVKDGDIINFRFNV